MPAWRDLLEGAPPPAPPKKTKISTALVFFMSWCADFESRVAQSNVFGDDEIECDCLSGYNGVLCASISPPAHT